MSRVLISLGALMSLLASGTFANAQTVSAEPPVVQQHVNAARALGHAVQDGDGEIVSAAG